MKIFMILILLFLVSCEKKYCKFEIYQYGKIITEECFNCENNSYSYDSVYHKNTKIRCDVRK